MSPANLLTEWARLLLGSLRAAGVRDVVLSPGSRSTPFTWAALQDAGLRCRTIIDERSAAFFAVGQARMTGEPALLVCTSGSAAANYFPAVVEAAESATPLLLLTADRPFELQHAAAPQTIDQTRLYGAYARRYFELGMPDAHPAMLQAVPRIAAQAVLAARSPVPGPVHLNARARKPLDPVDPLDPLDPTSADDDEAGRLRQAVDRLIERGPTRSSAPLLAPDPDAVRDLADACRRARRGVIVCGPASPWQAADPADVTALARVTGFPLVPEAASQQRFTPALGTDRVIDAFGTLLESDRFRERHEPDLVIQLGRPPTAAGWDPYLRGWPEAARAVVWPYGWSDPRGSATTLLPAALGPTVRALVEALNDTDGLPGQRDREEWLAALRLANDVAWTATDAVLADGYTEGAAARAVLEHLPPGGLLALGNSLPIRHADSFFRAEARDLAVWSQRGVNGIDGLISGAAGAAAASGRPTTLVVGDVSFLHDIGGLHAARDLPAALTIVVLNNRGGRIFERLPIADTAGPAFDAWLTPPGVDFGAAAAAFGLRFARCPTPESLAAALADARVEAGTIVIEALLPDGATTGPAREILRRIEADLA